jgi:hypothetical protein
MAVTVCICVTQLYGTAAALRQLAGAASAAVKEDPKPIWHRQFSIDFNGESIT